ncbi:MAG: SCP2 sterol-binding domain-containing protein [Anaerolineales bacterium]
MAIQFATDDWMRAVKQALTRSVIFRDAARNWRTEWLWAVTGGPEPVYLFFDLRYGDCVEAIRVKDPSQRAAEITLEGPASAWQRVIQKKLSLMQAITTKELNVTSGQSVKIMGAHRAAQELMNVIARIETEWPG